ncbi:MAG TPA: SRPBCC family protein [Ktedonobacteraceae bacterium]|nr:SRPBCC family protein [Ktedonobacteraceae bacterium]
MPVLHFTTHIEGSDETIFALIADLTGYDRWLPRSNAFGAVTKISQVPVGLGTTYVDKGPSGTMHGSVVDYRLPTHIAFQQSMPVKLLLLTGMLDLHIRYTLEPGGQTTQVNRDVSFYLPGVLKLAEPIIVTTVRRESQRLLLLMKRYVETQAGVGDQLSG